MPEQPGATLIVTDGETVAGTVEGVWFRCAATTWAAIEAELGTLKDRPQPREPWAGVNWIEHVAADPGDR